MTFMNPFGTSAPLTDEQKRQQALDSAWRQYAQDQTLNRTGANTGPENYRAMLRDQGARRAFELKYNQENATKDLNNLTPEQQARLNEVTVRNQELAAELERSKSPEAQEQARIDRARTERNKDLAEGRTRGEQLFGEGSLGRLSQESLDNLRRNAQGFTAEEQNAMRDQNLSTINQNNASQMRQLKIQQAQQGVRGGQAIAQANVQRNAQAGQVAANERELFLKNIDARRAGQSALIDSEKYANEQKNRERMAQITTELGYGALGSADRGAAMQAVIGQQQAAAAARQGGGGGGKK